MPLPFGDHHGENIKPSFIGEGLALKTADIAFVLRTRQDAAGLPTSEIARRAGCTVADAEEVLGGAAQVPVGQVVAVCEALGYVLVAVPRPAEFAVAAGAEVTEPKVETVVMAALRRVRHSSMSEVPSATVQDPPHCTTLFDECEDADAEEEALLSAAADECRKEARRLALHQAAVHVLRDHPDRAESALRTLDRWVANGFADHRLAQEWRGIIESKDWDVLLEQSDHGKRLRKGSPVCCVLDQDERLAIFQRFRRGKNGQD